MRGMFRVLVLMILLINFGTVFAGSSFKLKKGQIYKNKERFIVKGIGYSNCRPHEQPNTKAIDLEQEKEDFKLIREAGFNTIRTWKPLTIEELKLAEEFDLAVIQGSWVEYRQNFTDPEMLAQVAGNLKSMVKESSLASNILMYLVGNEPQPRQVFGVGLDKTNNFFLRLKDEIRSVSKNTPVAMSNWVQSDFLDDSMWDISTLNIYIYNPESVSHAMGYRGYSSWLKNERSPKKPFVITEMGLSVSKTGVGHKGYGGNSEEEQKNGVLYMYKEALAAGTDGACIFEWIDEWWKNFNHFSDKDIHETADPEEWFGICYYDEENKIHKRPVYEALKKFNQSIVISPKDSAVIKSRKIPVEVYVEDSISEVTASIDKEKWFKLKRKSDRWFKGKVPVKGLVDGEHTLYTRAVNSKTEEMFETEQRIFVNRKKNMKEPLKVEIILDNDTYYTKNRMTNIRLRFIVTDEKGNTVPGVKITSAIYEPVLNQRLILNLESNEEGMATHFYNINEEGILTVSAGVEAFPSHRKEGEDEKLVVKNGDCKHIKIFYEKK